MKLRVVIQGEQLGAQFLEACRLLSKVRYYRNRFESNRDAPTKTVMKQWEARADEFLSKLTLEPDEAK